MHPENVFVTLTYSDEHLKSDKLVYRDFQLFIKKLRKSTVDNIGYFVTGEYGEKNKRPHWHAIIFNWRPKDAKPKYKNYRGDQVYTSEYLDSLWGMGMTDFGSVTFESAGYCARYAAKKLVHGKDDEHEFKPISKKSSKHAIGKKFLEQYWKDIFTLGHVVLNDGTTTSIPRYYEKWLKKNEPEAWLDYVTRTKFERIQKAEEKQAATAAVHNTINNNRLDSGKTTFIQSENQVRKIITAEKFKLLQAKLKL